MYANLVRNWVTITIVSPQQPDARAAVSVKSHHRTNRGAICALMGSFRRTVSVSTVPLAGKVFQTEALVLAVRPLGQVHIALMARCALIVQLEKHLLKAVNIVRIVQMERLVSTGCA